MLGGQMGWRRFRHLVEGLPLDSVWWRSAPTTKSRPPENRTTADLKAFLTSMGVK